jgi:hypothetical protein
MRTRKKVLLGCGLVFGITAGAYALSLPWLGAANAITWAEKPNECGAPLSCPTNNWGLCVMQTDAGDTVDTSQNGTSLTGGEYCGTVQKGLVIAGCGPAVVGPNACP